LQLSGSLPRPVRFGQPRVVEGVALRLWKECRALLRTYTGTIAIKKTMGKIKLLSFGRSITSR